MSLFDKLMGHGRIKRAKKELAGHTSPMNYAQLAYEYACQGKSREASRVCEEGLSVFPGSSELSLMADRVRRLHRDSRMQELKRELAEAPRPALWAEMCEILLEGGQIARAEECAVRWFENTRDDDALLIRSRALVERFLADRGREAGLAAFEALEEVQVLLDGDPRPWRLHVQLAWRIGAWKEARRAVSHLLQIEPGDPVLEARYRTLDSFAENSPSIEEALRTVERTGRLVDDKASDERPRTDGHSVRHVLRELAGEKHVHAALYLRGSTALVQGPKGATAERTARAARLVLQSGRSAARKLGLGQVSEFHLEGDFGTLALTPGEVDAGALWCSGPVSKAQLATIMNLAGLEAVTTEDDE